MSDRLGAAACQRRRQESQQACRAGPPGSDAPHADGHCSARPVRGGHRGGASAAGGGRPLAQAAGDAEGAASGKRHAVSLSCEPAASCHDSCESTGDSGGKTAWKRCNEQFLHGCEGVNLTTRRSASSFRLCSSQVDRDAGDACWHGSSTRVCPSSCPCMQVDDVAKCSTRLSRGHGTKDGVRPREGANLEAGRGVGGDPSVLPSQRHNL